MSSGKRKIVIRAVILSAISIALLIIATRMIDNWQKNQYREVRADGNNDFLNSDLVTWKGKEYKKTPAVTTLLIAGIDLQSDQQRGVGTSRYRNGGQADFLLLLAIDNTNRQIHQLQIDRDTMAAVTVLSVYGQETGEREMQICLSHSYGANKEENARYMVKAVRKLLNDLDIDEYYTLDYSAVSVLNDALGGVTVTVPDDMTSVDPKWQTGSTITLHGQEAELFVRTRKTVGEGTNKERMSRQGEFMRQAINAIRERISNDPDSINQLLNALRTHSTTNLSDIQLAAEIQNASGYEVLPIEYLDGEYTIGESGYVEFYVKEGSPEDWIMRHLYTKL